MFGGYYTQVSLYSDGFILGGLYIRVGFIFGWTLYSGGLYIRWPCIRDGSFLVALYSADLIFSLYTVLF